VRIRQLAAEPAGAGGRGRRLAVAAVAPEQRSRDQVRSFAAQKGFTIGATTGFSMELRGERTALARAFQVKVVDSADGYHPATPLVLPQELTAVAQAATGLDTRPLLRPHAVPTGFSQTSLHAAYRGGGTATSGAGITVATVQFAPYNPADVASYAAAAGISFGPTQQITGVPVAGAVATASPGDYEASLDVEAILAAAPGASQRVYVADQSIAGSAVQIYSQIADDVVAGKVQVVSTSWGVCEGQMNGLNGFLDPIFQRILAAGGTVFAASGDSGAYDCSAVGSPDARLNVDYPVSSPYVVGVGGTHLTDAGAAAGWAETAWAEPQAIGSPATTYQGNASGGGASTSEPRPSYQGSLPFSTHRLVPDIAAVGDPGTGLAVFHAPEGWTRGGGTSLSAPLEAAFLADGLSAAGRTNGIGDILPGLYQHPGAFRDVTTGANYQYRAGTGYDQVTGLGAPLWDLLAPLVIPGYPTLSAPATSSPPPTAQPSLSPPVQASVTAAASATRVPWPAVVTFSGTLSRAGAPVEGGVLQLLSRPLGSSVWQVGPSRSTDAFGQVGFPLRVPASADYQLRSTDGALSPVMRVFALRTATLFGATVIRLGSGVTFAGVVSPTAAGQSVVLQFFNGRQWQPVAGVRCDRGGGWRAITRPTRRGSFRYRLLIPADAGHLMSASAARGLLVR
jgi:hypothetical protein